jgi:hypothetical protein
VRESCDGITHTGSQDGRILPVVGDDDESAEDSTLGSHRKDKQTNFLATWASTFSRNWQAPPPLIQCNLASTLQAFHTVTEHVDVIWDLLIRAVDGDIEFWILRDVTES